MMVELTGRLSLGLYKCSTMGILPTGTSDWLQFENRNDVRLIPTYLLPTGDTSANSSHQNGRRFDFHLWDRMNGCMTLHGV